AAAVAGLAAALALTVVLALTGVLVPGLRIVARNGELGTSHHAGHDGAHDLSEFSTIHSIISLALNTSVAAFGGCLPQRRFVRQRSFCPHFQDASRPRGAAARSPELAGHPGYAPAGGLDLVATAFPSRTQEAVRSKDDAIGARGHQPRQRNADQPIATTATSA